MHSPSVERGSQLVNQMSNPKKRGSKVTTNPGTEKQYRLRVDYMAKNYGAQFELAPTNFCLSSKNLSWTEFVRLGLEFPTYEQHIAKYEDTKNRPHYINVPMYVNQTLPNMRVGYRNLNRAAYHWFIKVWNLHWPKMPTDEEMIILGLLSKSIGRELPGRVMSSIGLFVRLFVGRHPRCHTLGDSAKLLRTTYWKHVEKNPLRLHGLQLFQTEKEALDVIGNYMGSKWQPNAKIFMTKRGSNTFLSVGELLAIEEFTRDAKP